MNNKLTPLSSTLSSVPWRIFSRIALFQTGLIFVSMLISIVTIRSDAPSTFGLLIGAAFVLSLVSLWVAYVLVFPIGRLLTRTRGILSATPEPLTEAEMSRESFGEWTDIESNFNEIRNDLENKRRRLDRDRLELATIIGSLSDAIVAVDPEGAPLFFNSRFAMLFNRGNRGGDLKLWDLVREPAILDAFGSALRKGISEATRTFNLEFESEGRRFLTLSVSPLKRADGSVYGAVGIFHDVTELKLAEQMRIDFVANVSHELRTPLTSIKGYADTLQDDLVRGNPINTQFMSIISKNTNRLMNLISDLLDLSSIESQSQSLHVETLATSEVTNRALNQLTERFRSKDQRIEETYDAKSVTADSASLDQVLVNLLDNASKYTPSGGRISIGWAHTELDTLLTVSDTGPGIPHEHQSRLFERFYRVDKARSRELGGTGLGLAIVKHIMHRHEGSVAVQSVVGGGSSFVCRFPKNPVP